MSKIEVLTVRDPDGPTTVRMFVDGVETNDYTEYDVDAGAGHMRSDWVETNQEIEADEDLTPAFKAAVLAARENPPGSKYIEDDRRSPWDLAWELADGDQLVSLWSDYASLSEEEKDRLDGFACEQVSRAFIAKLREAGWDAWLMHGDDAESVDGLIGEHYWVAVDDGAQMTEHLDLTYQQFANVADPEIALGVGAAGNEWPLTWHTFAESPRHHLVKYRTVVRVDEVPGE